MFPLSANHVVFSSLGHGASSINTEFKALPRVDPHSVRIPHINLMPTCCNHFMIPTSNEPCLNNDLKIKRAMLESSILGISEIDHLNAATGEKSNYIASMSSSSCLSKRGIESEDGKHTPRRYFRKCKYSEEEVAEFLAQKRHEKRERNRKSAADARPKQKETVHELRDEIDHLRRALEMSSQENQMLKKMNLQGSVYPGTQLNMSRQNTTNQNTDLVEAAICVLELL